jgi:hypothetical protein
MLPGSPIRKSSDHSSVDSSPRLIAASYVLHRLLVPRHPPCALNNLATKMLASTVQFSTNGRPHNPTRTHPHRGSFTEIMVRTAASPQHPQQGSQGPDGLEEAPAPSGPNSAPCEPNPQTPRRSTPLQRPGVLAAKTLKPARSQCSTPVSNRPA